MRIALASFVLAASMGAALAQPQPYAGMQVRPLKALSDQQIDDLRSGRGMGLALAAELNGYPGPSHVLEFSDRIGLTGEQRARVQLLLDQMKAEAVALGEKLIPQEIDLDRQFATKHVTPVSLAAATSAIAETQGMLRNAHLKYHLETLEILTLAQVSRYAELRGYQGDAQPHAPAHHHR